MDERHAFWKRQPIQVSTTLGVDLSQQIGNDTDWATILIPNVHRYQKKRLTCDSQYVKFCLYFRMVCLFSDQNEAKFNLAVFAIEKVLHGFQLVNVISTIFELVLVKTIFFQKFTVINFNPSWLSAEVHSERFLPLLNGWDDGVD